MGSDSITRDLFSKLSVDDISALNGIVPELDDAFAREWVRLRNDSLRWRSLTLRFCTHYVPESRARTGLSDKIPPADVHMMQRADIWFVGDFYSSNMAVECLEAVQVGFNAGKNYLDFGCSSGSLVRMMTAYAPQTHWFGVDPVPESVKWASENLTNARFSISDQRPPLDFSENSFSGVTAISIWSHFSELPALRWFDEMARIIEPGGWLFFTAHGNQTIRWLKDRIEPERVEYIRMKMRKNQFHFDDVFAGEAHYGLETSDWGDAYFSPKWVLNNLSSKWDLLFFLEGRNQNNQDCYILKRRWV